MPPKNRPHVPSVLVCHEKHGNRYFNALTEEDLYKSALKIVKERSGPDYCYYNDPEEFRASPPDIPREMVNAMPPGRTKDSLLNQWIAYKRHEADHKESVDEYQRIANCIRDNDGKAAFRILCDRSDHEYERIEVEKLL